MEKRKLAKLTFSLTILLTSLVEVLNADCPVGGTCENQGPIQYVSIWNHAGYDLSLNVDGPKGQRLGSIVIEAADKGKEITTSLSSAFIVDGSRITFTKVGHKKPAAYIMKWTNNQAVAESLDLNLSVKFEQHNGQVSIQLAEKDIFKAVFDEALKMTLDKEAIKALYKKNTKTKLKKQQWF